MTAPPWSSTAPPQALTEPTTTGGEHNHDGAYHQNVVGGPEPAQEQERQEGHDQAPAHPDIETFPMTALPRHDAPEAFRQWPVVPPPPAYPMLGEPEEPGRSRTVMIVAVVVVLLALVALVGVGVLLLSREAAPPSGPASPAAASATAGAPSADRPPPTDLTLRDDSATITLRWTDPAGGGVPFMVAGGRAGQKLGVMATVDPGQTSYTVNGLNSRVDYCFTVLAVYSTDTFATSGQVCTERENGTPAT
ncbi:Fibronectin type III domain-containing protein [Micromonospora citrea]|uniref:Fibronectin type III domain-containing protein n=1 Tax=Micromonospora citrea TaxID=47855 RepID=A0A1C6VVR6_9ACTN|nr:Fibronectin type III domain-containing protein [Micromonospora citrea]